MASTAAHPHDDKRAPEARMDTLEKLLALDTRLQKLEQAVGERIPENKPWWKDAKTVTILGSLIAAVLLLLKFMDDYSRSMRENRRLVTEQQEKIRQTYLEKVLKPGVTVAEQEKIFALLKELSTDPEMQKWALKEHESSAASVE